MFTQIFSRNPQTLVSLSIFPELTMTSSLFLDVSINSEEEVSTGASTRFKNLFRQTLTTISKLKFRFMVRNLWDKWKSHSQRKHNQKAIQNIVKGVVKLQIMIIKKYNKLYYGFFILVQNSIKASRTLKQNLQGMCQALSVSLSKQYRKDLLIEGFQAINTAYLQNQFATTNALLVIQPLFDVLNKIYLSRMQNALQGMKRRQKDFNSMDIFSQSISYLLNKKSIELYRMFFNLCTKIRKFKKTYSETSDATGFTQVVTNDFPLIPKLKFNFETSDTSRSNTEHPIIMVYSPTLILPFQKHTFIPRPIENPTLQKGIFYDSTSKSHHNSHPNQIFYAFRDIHCDEGFINQQVVLQKRTQTPAKNQKIDKLQFKSNLRHGSSSDSLGNYKMKEKIMRSFSSKKDEFLSLLDKKTKQLKEMQQKGQSLLKSDKVYYLNPFVVLKDIKH